MLTLLKILGRVGAKMRVQKARLPCFALIWKEFLKKNFLTIFIFSRKKVIKRVGFGI